MDRQQFSYQLPDALIARYPAAQRSGSRLLHLARNSGEINHRQFTELVDLVEPNDLLVFNDTRVIPARLFGHKASGGKVEVLIERITGGSRGIAQIRASKPPQPETIIELEQGFTLRVISKLDDMYLVESVGDMSLSMVMQAVGHMPLPPYIDRDDEKLDQERYQTVYAKREGAVAAPTAGLHFDQALLDAIARKGVSTAFVTLHVGAGTFQPVRVDDIAEHVMHAEYVEVSAELCNKVRETKAQGGRIIAVGTTAVRCLETASGSHGWIEPYYGDTEIFIHPGYTFKTVDAMITNFHLPESTLLMLVSAFAGLENTMAAYSEAIEQQYRFYSYGDAMFIG
jgi:S-adenosylmethionine:tRNA ribosyltransferase-isomerase